MLPVHEGSLALLNLDVWIEIIRQFRINFQDDYSTCQSKETALRTLSLVSRQLAPLAQLEMWRTVSSAKHVARYIVNAEGSNVVDMSTKFLRRPLDAKSRAQVLRMLSYTRTFICKSSNDDNPDLDLEFVLLAIGRAPLFVNLDTIIVDSNACHRFAATKMSPMIASSSVERVIYRYLTPKDEKSVLLLHSNLQMHNAPITSVEVLEGHRVAPFIAPRLLCTAAPGISLNIHSLNLLDGNSLSLWYLGLSSSPNLIDLRIVFKTPNGGGTALNKLVKDERIQFAKLQRLEVHASGREDVLSYLDCPSLVSFSLHLASIAALSTIFTSLAHFTRMESLSITIKEKNPILGLKDLYPVIDSLASLRDLTILGVTSQLVEGDIVRFLTTRPFLRSLIISGPKSTPLPLSTLFSIPEPQSSQLEIICLPIDLSEIASLSTLPIWPVITTLKRFIIWDGNRIPDTMREKLKLAEFVLRVFPHARVDSLTDDCETRDWRLVKDLEELRYYISRTSS